VNLTSDKNTRNTDNLAGDEAEEISLDVSDSTEDESLSKDSKLVELNVIRASLMLPLEHVQEMPVPNEDAQASDALRVLKVSGKRRVGNFTRDRVYYFASHDKEDHDNLLDILKKHRRKIDLEPEAAAPAAAEQM